MKKILSLFVVAVSAPVLTLIYSNGGFLSESEDLNLVNSIEVREGNEKQEVSKSMNQSNSEEQALLPKLAKEEVKQPLEQSKNNNQQTKNNGFVSNVQEDDYRPSTYIRK